MEAGEGPANLCLNKYVDSFDEYSGTLDGGSPLSPVNFKEW